MEQYQASRRERRKARKQLQQLDRDMLQEMCTDVGTDDVVKAVAQTVATSQSYYCALLAHVDELSDEQAEYLLRASIIITANALKPLAPLVNTQPEKAFEAILSLIASAEYSLDGTKYEGFIQEHTDELVASGNEQVARIHSEEAIKQAEAFLKKHSGDL